MPTFDHPVGGTCVAVGHPGVGTGAEPRGVRGRGGSLFCQGPRLWCRVLRQASRMCAVAGCFSCCSSGITRWSLRALSDGGSLLLRLRWLWGRIGGYLAAVVACLHPKFVFFSFLFFVLFCFFFLFFSRRWCGGAAVAVAEQGVGLTRRGGRRGGGGGRLWRLEGEETPWREERRAGSAHPGRLWKRCGTAGNTPEWRKKELPRKLTHTREDTHAHTRIYIHTHTYTHSQSHTAILWRHWLQGFPLNNNSVECVCVCVFVRVGACTCEWNCTVGYLTADHVGLWDGVFFLQVRLEPTKPTDEGDARVDQKSLWSIWHNTDLCDRMDREHIMSLTYERRGTLIDVSKKTGR